MTLTILTIRDFNQIYSRLSSHTEKILQNPQWLLTCLLSRFASIRSLHRKIFNQPGIGRTSSQNSLFPQLNLEQAITNLHENGYIKDIDLPPEILSQLLQYGHSAKAHGDGSLDSQFCYEQKEALEAQQQCSFSRGTFPNLQADLELIQTLGEDPKLQMIAAKYFGRAAQLSDSRLWWNFASEAEVFDTTKTASFFHYEKDDFNCLRLFFYLTDVNEQSGPHICVRGSHKNKGLKQLFSLQERGDEEIINYYGAENLITLTGPAGSGFMEDSFCFHRASRPTAQDRLILALTFTTPPEEDWGQMVRQVSQRLWRKIRGKITHTIGGLRSPDPLTRPLATQPPKQ